MRAGELRHKVIIQKISDNVNSFNQPDEDDWVDVATARAAINPLSGREFFAAEQNNSEVTHKVKMRYIAGVLPNMRIKFGTRYFGIIAVLNVEERNRELQIMCKELFNG